jgi:hypothetical protein
MFWMSAGMYLAGRRHSSDERVIAEQGLVREEMIPARIG